MNNYGFSLEEMACSFCNVLNEQEGFEPVYSYEADEAHAIITGNGATIEGANKDQLRLNFYKYFKKQYPGAIPF